MSRGFQRTIHFIAGIGANISLKGVSFLLAILLWVIVLGSRSVEVTKEVPLEIVTPADLTPASDIPEKLAFRLSGPKAFLRAILDRREEPIKVNLVGSKPGPVTYRFFSDNIRLPIGVKVLAIQPQSITLRLEAVKSKDVPVKVETRGLLPEGYQILSRKIVPDRVRVQGAASALESLGFVQARPIDITDLRHSIDLPLQIEFDRANLRLVSENPVMALSIAPVSANYRLKNIDVKILSDQKVKSDVTQVTLLIRADLNQLRKIDRGQIQVVIDLRGKPRGKYRETIRAVLPEGIGLVRAVPAQANITLF